MTTTKAAKNREGCFIGITDTKLNEIKSQQSQNRSPISRYGRFLPSKCSNDGGSSLQNVYNISSAEEQRQFMEVTGGGGSIGCKHEEPPLFSGSNNNDISVSFNDGS